MQVEDGTLCRMASPVPGPVGPSANPVAHWSIRTKLLEAARRAIPKLPADSRQQFASLFSATNIEITGGVLALWAGSHFFGVGEAADLALLGIGVVTMGTAAFGVGRDLGSFLALATHAQTEADLDRAASHLAQAVVTMGVMSFIALIMKAGSRFKRPGLVGASAGETIGAASAAEETVTVGRWMSKEEYNAMLRTGRVQESPNGGAKGVLYPPNPASYKAAPPGDIYVEFDVPKSSLEGKSLGQSAISGPNSPRGRLAVQKGLAPLEMPQATNIRIVRRK